MRAHAALFAAVLACLPSRAQAGAQLSEELGVSTSPAAGSLPRTGAVINSLSGSVDLSEAWSLRLGVNLSVSTPTPSEIAPQLKPRSSASVAFLPAVDWEPSEHVSSELSLTLSPRSTSQVDSSLRLSGPQGQTAEAAALISSVSSALGAALWFGYDTAGDSDFEVGASGAVGVTRFSTTQRILALEGMDASLAAAARYCAAHGCSKQQQALLDRLESGGALKAHSDAFEQVSLAASLSATLFRNTDAAIAGTCYLYPEDPTQVGYFSLASVRGSASFGAGAPLAPPQWSLRPDLAQRFGDLQVGLWFQHTQYVSGEGRGELLGLKIQYRLSRALRAWLSAAVQRDRDAQEAMVQTSSASLGVKVRW